MDATTSGQFDIVTDRPSTQDVSTQDFSLEVSNVTDISEDLKSIGWGVYFTVSTVVIICGNSLLFAVVKASDELHNKHYFLLCVNGVNDIIMNVVYGVFIYVILLVPDYKKFSGVIRVIRWGTLPGAICVLSQFTLGSFISIERMVYFVYPLRYDRYMTSARLVLGLVIIYSISAFYYIVTEVTIGREVPFVALHVILPNKNGSSLLILVIFYLPSLLTTLGSALAIAKLIWNKNRVQPGDVVQIPANDLFLKKAKTAIRLILLVCGVLWGTSLPATIIRSVIGFKGYTFEEMDRGLHYEAALATRISAFMYATTSSVLNPIIYFYTHGELRECASKLRQQWRQQG